MLEIRRPKVLPPYRQGIRVGEAPARETLTSRCLTLSPEDGEQMMSDERTGGGQEE